MNGPSHWVPARTEPVLPSPAMVTDLVSRLVESAWPTSEADRRRWFEEFGLREAPEGEYWDGEAESGDAPTDWHSFDGEFAGVNWFIWAGWPRTAVEVAASELKDGFTSTFGPPSDEVEPRAVGHAKLWRVNGRMVHLYFHSGLPPAEINRPESAAVVQLAVDHEQRAEAKDRKAQSEQREEG